MKPVVAERRTVLCLSDIGGIQAGGKAEGLKKLHDRGLTVPETWVVIDPLSPDLSHDLEPVYSSFGDRPVAVRSSAADEDSNGASFAGQFATFLNIRGQAAIRGAVEDCLESASSGRVAEYAGHLLPDANLSMSVVIQEMVNATCAGVIFTADPVSGRRDTAVVNAVAGLGEELVSGHASGQQYLVSRSGRLISSRGTETGALLNEGKLKEILDGARLMERFLGAPQDMEWAIDESDKLYWLQTRPITTLPDVHLNEIDSPFDETEPVLTRGNIGEMMPGPVTPLTESFFAYGIDWGLQMFYARMGVHRKPKPGERRYIYSFYNHLFFSLSRMYIMPQRIVSATRETVDYSITGEVLAIPWKVKKKSGLAFMRLIRFIRYFRYINTAPKVLTALREKVEAYHFDDKGTIEEIYERLNLAKEIMAHAWSDHYCTSGQSGALSSIILQVLSGGKAIPDVEHYRQVARLLVSIEGIDGADALASLDRLAESLSREPGAAASFTGASPEEALAWLKGSSSGISGELFAAFMKENGHRGIREAELIETSWEAEPLGLIRLLQARMTMPSVSRGREGANFDENLRDILSNLGLVQRMVVKNQIPKLRESVARRENSKSLCIRLSAKIKKGYLALADLLVDREYLNERDEIYFLTHKEIGELIATGSPMYKRKAFDRRKLFPVMKSLVFADHHFAYPEPIEHDDPQVKSEGDLTGLPVSTGTVRGRARVVHSLEDAVYLEPGEIMVVSLTDIGWTPYFSVIGGLITEIGSSLSHGAVVAREYGIPAVVNVKNARRLIQSGDYLELDGDRGTVTFIEGLGDLTQ